MATCIQLKNLTKCYGDTVAVSGLSLEVERGEVLGLLGPNGAGKSTTLYMLTGLVRPTSGAVTVFGKDIRKQYLEVAGRIGAAVERPAFYDHLSVRRNLMLMAQLAGRDVTVDRVLDMVGLLHAGSRKAGALSHGMRQRLGLALALLTEPELLILDEPTSGLDVESTQEVLKMLRRLADEAGVTILLSSHMMHEVEVLCDRVAILNQGRLVACDRTDALLSYDLHQVEVLVDVPEAAAKKLGEQAWVASVEIAPGRLQVALEDGNVHQLAAFLISSGFRLSGIMPRRRTLQDYFLKVLSHD